MRKTIIVVSLLMILSKILGFIREISLAYFYGASFISDAYLVSISIPITLYTLFGVVIAQGLIPIFNKINLNEGSNEVNKFLSNILNVLTIINFLISIFGFINPYLLISIFAGGLTGNTLMLAVQFTRISIFGLIFTNLVYITSAFLRANKKFYIPAFVGIPLNIGIILSIFLSSIYGFHILPYGTLLSMIIEFLFIIPSLLKQNFRYSFVINLRSSYLINFVNLSIPLILSTIFFQISRSVDRYLASSLFNGAISSLNYSFRLISFIEGVLILPVLTVVFPKLSELYERKQLSNFNTLSNKTLSIILYLTIPIVTLTIINSESIVRMVYYRGAFNDSALIFTSLSLRIYALSIIPVALKEHYTRLFIAMNKSKTLYYVNFLSFSLMIILNLILFSEMGFIGIPLSYSIGMAFASFIFFILSQINSDHKNNLKWYVNVIVASLASISGSLLVNNLIVLHSFDLFYLEFILKSILVFLFVFIIGLIFQNSFYYEIMDEIRHTFASKMRRK